MCEIIKVSYMDESCYGESVMDSWASFQKALIRCIYYLGEETERGKEDGWTVSLERDYGQNLS